MTLSWQEVLCAGMVGVLRQVSAMQHRRPSAHGNDETDSWTQHVEGAAAEMAVAKHLGHYWQPLTTGALNGGPADVGTNVQARSTQRENGSLILHLGDPDDHLFYLVIVKTPVFEVVGWIAAAEGKLTKFWRDDVPTPAFFVPQRVLVQA